MTNAYYSSPTDVEAGAKVRSIDLNSIDAATDAAFDKLPTETNIKQGKVNYAVDSGAADAYVVSLPHAPASYADGLLVSFRPTNTNTGASTINVNSLGVKSIRNTSGNALSAGDITAGSPIDIRYSTATGFFHLAPNSTNSATAAATSATAAASSASAAAASASSASTSATAAAASAASFSASTGSAGIGHIASGTGAVATTVAAKFQDEFVSVFDFMSSAQRDDVKAGTATLDVVAAFAAAIATGKPVSVPMGPGWKYKFGSTLSVPSNTTLFSNRAKIVLASGVNNHVMRIANGADNVEISGFDIDGVKASNTGGSGIAMGGTGGTNIRIKNNYVHDCSSHGIYTAGSSTVTGIDVSGNYCYNNYSGGITADDTTAKFAFERNFCWNNGTHGVGLIGIGQDGAIVGNVCWDNGQGTPNADNLTGYNGSNDNLTISGNISRGGLNNGIHFGGSRITYSGNTAYGATMHGILHTSSSGPANDVTMTGNVSYGNGLDGIRIVGSNSGSVTGNIAKSNTERGISTSNCTNLTISSNTAHSNTLDGIANNGAASAYMTYSGNVTRSNGGDGIDLADITLATVIGNNCNTNTGYGINTGGTEGSNIISGNFVRTNTAGQIASMAANTAVFGNDTGSGGTASTGTGKVVLDTSPTLTTPTIGVAAATSINKVAITAPASSATLTIADGKTFTANRSLTLTGTDSTTMTFPGTSATIARTDAAQTFTGTQTFGLIVSSVANGADAVRVQNSSLSGTKAWELYPVTNGTDTDLNLYEFATSGSGDRFKFKAGGALQSGSTTVISSAGHLTLRSYTVATLPTATSKEMIYVSDGTSNKRLAVADGTNWRFPDGAVVS
jgi:parallel beta-helix repeat protein